VRARQRVVVSIGVVLLFALAAAATFAQGVNAAGVPKKQMPDLTVYDIWWYPGDPIAGESTTIYVTIKNIGAKDIKHETFYTQLKIDGTQVMISSIEDLNAGSTYTFIKTVTLASGTHTLWAYVDYYDLIDEKYETNNYREEYVTAIALPDVAMVDIWTEPCPPISEQYTYIRIQISVNEVPFTETMWTRVYVDGVFKAGFGMPGSTGAQVKTYTYTTSQLDPGDHEIRAVTDADNVLTESSETNNERTETYCWESPSLPNVKAVDIWTDPSSPVEAETTTIWFSISTNSVPFGETVYTRLYIDDVLKVTKYLYGSPGTGTYTYSYLTVQTAGDHTIRVLTDATDVLAESVETDNQRTESHEWQPSSLPDVAAVDIWTDPDPPTGGQTATVYFSISTSSVPFTQTIYTRLYIDDVYKTTRYLYGSSGSATHSYSYSTTQSTGNHVIRIVTDATGVLTEAWETNNERSETINWQALPDVAAVDIWTSPSPPNAGQSATISFSISTNSVPFTQTIYTRLYIDDVYKTTRYLYGSSGSGTHTYTYSTTQSAGDHVVKIITDATGVLTESSETNNERTETYTWVDLDSDGDGLTDSYEISIGTDPYDPTTDSDAWNDGDEVLKYYTNPLLADTDGDTVRDDQDYDPLNDLQVTVRIKEVFARDLVDADGADFWWIVWVNGNIRSSASPWAWNQNHIYPAWTTTVNVPDNVRYVSIEIGLLDYQGGGNNLWCDIDDTGQYNNDQLELTYDVCTGSWSEEDYPSDLSGYGHTDGTFDGDANPIYPDCAIWFSVYQDDDDGDGMVYWEEVNTYHTNPVSVNDAGGDWDTDGMPNGWEDSHGLNPVFDDRWSDLDSDLVDNKDEYELRGRGKSPCNPLDTYCMDLSITLRFDADYQYMGKWIAGMRVASNVLFEATNGYFLIKSVTIYDNDVNRYWSDIVVLDEVCDSSWDHSWPHLCGDPTGGWADDDGDVGPRDDSGAKHWIVMPRQWQPGGPGTTIYDPNTLKYSETVVHEMGHYSFCVFDEYVDGDGNTIPEDERLVTLMALPWDSYEFSTLVDYQNPPPGTDTDTWQWDELQESCWQTLFRYWNYFSTTEVHNIDLVWALLPSDGNRYLGVQFDLNGDGVIDTGYTNGYVADTFPSLYEYDPGADLTPTYENS